MPHFVFVNVFVQVETRSYSVVLKLSPIVRFFPEETTPRAEEKSPEVQVAGTSPGMENITYERGLWI